MEEIEVKSLDELVSTVRNTAEHYQFDDSYTIHSPGAILYRGQSDSRWGLRTTLSRKSSIVSFKEYLSLCGRVKPALETEFDLNFSKMTILELEEIFKELSWLTLMKLPWYDYLLYLRHNGFPSPILDWTQSLYLALGFAFFKEKESASRAIYMYVEKPLSFKAGSVGEPEIYRVGQYVKTSRRHFLQQSMYTICYSQQPGDLRFESYDLIKKPQNHEQDVLIKFIIPSSEREKILKFLFSVNITPYSIMPTEETLLQTLWLKEHKLRTNSAQTG